MNTKNNIKTLDQLIDRSTVRKGHIGVTSLIKAMRHLNWGK